MDNRIMKVDSSHRKTANDLVNVDLFAVVPRIRPSFILFSSFQISLSEEQQNCGKGIETGDSNL